MKIQLKWGKGTCCMKLNDESERERIFIRERSRDFVKKSKKLICALNLYTYILFLKVFVIACEMAWIHIYYIAYVFPTASCKQNAVTVFYFLHRICIVSTGYPHKIRTGALHWVCMRHRGAISCFSAREVSPCSFSRFHDRHTAARVTGMEIRKYGVRLHAEEKTRRRFLSCDGN